MQAIQTKRQSMENPFPLFSKNTSIPITGAIIPKEHLVLYTVHFRIDPETLNEKQKLEQKKYRAGWDETTNRDMLRKPSVTSINSFDSGYSSRKASFLDNTLGEIEKQHDEDETTA